MNTSRSSMTQSPIQRNVYTLVPSMNSINKTNETTNVLTAHNTNTPSRISTTSSNVYDDSLTNLSWLHDINILKRTIPTINISSSSSSTNTVGNNNTLNGKRKEQCSSNTSMSLSSTNAGAVHPNDIDDSNELILNNDDDDDEQWRIYKANPHIKPVYSYSQLILLAMKQSGHEKMTLQMIYEWVADNFPYFKKMEPTWQNSIRHNLSLNKCFVKIPRTKKEAGGKGGFWKLSPDYQRQRLQNKISATHSQDRQVNSLTNKRLRLAKRAINICDNAAQLSVPIKSEAWLEPTLPCVPAKHSLPVQYHGKAANKSSSYVRMPSSFLSPISSPDSLVVPTSFHHQQPTNESTSTSVPSPSSSPSSMSSALMKQNAASTKLDDTDMLLLDSGAFDWDAYLCETPNDIDVQPFLSTKTEQDLFNDFNAALTDLTYSAEMAAAGGDPSAFDGFDYPTKNTTFNSLFEDDVQQNSLAIKGRGIKRPSWWLTNETVTPTKLPSLEAAFDLKLSK